MEKHINITMDSNGIGVNVAGTPLDILFMVALVIKDIHESSGIPYDKLGEILNSAVNEVKEERES